MAYSQGGLIQATDYNNLLWGGTQGTYTLTPNNIAYVLGVGNGQYGYGQDVSALTTTTVNTAVSATQWSTLLTALNKAINHQGGTAVTVTPAITAGALITYSSALNTAVTTINTNRNSFVSQGSTTTGTVFTANASAAFGVAYNTTVATRSVTFSSGDAARYFFNCGGQLNFVITSVTNNDGTARSGDAVTVIQNNFGGWNAFRNASSVGRTGTGGTVNTNATTIGYSGITATAASTQLLSQITSTTASYTTDVMRLYVYSSAQNASGNGDKGATVYFQLTFNSPAHSTFNGTLNVTVNHRVDIVFPETTYLTTSWSTPTVA